MMAQPSRTRRILKWTGLLFCLLIVAVWGITLFWVVSYWWNGGGIGVGECGAFFFWSPGRPAEHWRVSSTLDHFRHILPSIRHAPSRVNKPPLMTTRYCVPLWIILLVIGIPTAWLWYRDRRRYPPGHCQRCGYDLTGNVSGRCPECGEGITPSQLETK